MSMAKAVDKANRYVEVGIKTSVALGKGSGPINHFHSTYTLPFSQYVHLHSVRYESMHLTSDLIGAGSYSTS